TSGSPARRGSAVWLASPECGLPTAASQFQPWSAGCSANCERLNPNVNAPTTTATAVTPLTNAVRTGTALRPRPDSNARAPPPTGLGPEAARPKVRATHEERWALDAPLFAERRPPRVARHATIPVQPTSTVAIAAAPSTSTSPSTE